MIETSQWSRVPLTRTPRHENFILIGDFNAREGRDHDKWPTVIGRHGVGNCNANGDRVTPSDVLWVRTPTDKRLYAERRTQNHLDAASLQAQVPDRVHTNKTTRQIVCTQHKRYATSQLLARPPTYKIKDCISYQGRSCLYINLTKKIVSNNGYLMFVFYKFSVEKL